MSVPSSLPPRYEVRVLDKSHLAWALAIVCHSNSFHSPLWTPIYADCGTEKCYEVYKGGEYLIEHQINSGYSLGVFNTEYVFKRPESAATGGKLYWDPTDTTATRETLLEQMDFPLVSVAMAYDSADPLDFPRLTGLFTALPAFPLLHVALESLDARPKAAWEAQGPGEVLFRAATSTRADHEGRGVMKALAHALMRRAAEQGFRGVQIECAHPAVTHTWAQPPAPFRGEVVASLEAAEWEVEGTYPFRPADLTLTKVYVTLR